MKKVAIVLALALGPLALAASPASACDEHKKTQAAAGKAEKVALEGKVVTVGCPMEAAKKDCTGAALVVGETKHPIKNGSKGRELASKVKDTDKQVKVTGTQEGEYLTVSSYQIKG
jgi:hypothetical protein